MMSLLSLVLMVICFFLNLAEYEDKYTKEYITFTLQYHQKSNGEWIKTDVSIDCDYFPNDNYR